ncbi:MAG: hypothetical protein PHG65_08930 [Kiritimatiellae bacterium]|nr:hypothetical protein [Kiritimatiellia bacterium]
MRIKKWMGVAVMAGAIAVLESGCEWSSGGGAGSWSDSYNWVNFSGTYRGIGGGVLVTDYTTTPGTPGTTNKVTGLSAGTTVKDKVTYGGNVDGNLVPGTIQLTVGGYVYTDPSGNGVLSCPVGGSGAVDYSAGRWDVNLAGLPVEAGKAITISYSYAIQGSSGSTGAGSGTTGAKIYSFVVWQNGQELQITDNNGRTYSGTMGSVSGTLTSTNQTAIVGDSIVAQFSAEGISAANYRVTIAGNLQGVVGGAAGVTYLNNRKMFGTWIEDGGRTGDVNGEASPIAVTASETSTDTTTTTE